MTAGPIRQLLLSFLLAAALWMQGGTASAQTAIADNPLLSQLYAQDQAERQDAATVDWRQLMEKDKQRRTQVMELLSQGQVRTANDYRHAAMVFQHGDGIADIRLANALASLAAALAPDDKQYRWLVAASWDRMMVKLLQPQWYGTQFNADSRGAYLYPMDETAVTDAERMEMGVPTAAESRARVTQAAKMMGASVRAVPPTLEQLRAEALAAAKEP